VVCVDLFSKWPETQPVQVKSVRSVYNFFLSLVCSHGCPSIVITDQGREFCNSLVDEFLASIYKEHRTSSAYHPRTNGQEERFNQTLKTAFRKLVDENTTN
jgi:hypothetical protein